MKVVQINCVYANGSTGKIVLNLHNALKNAGHDSLVIYGRGQGSNDPLVIKTSSEFGAKVHSALSKLFGGAFSHSLFATKKAIKILKRENPDVVHLHCLNGNFINVYKLTRYLKKNHIKTVLTLHAEIMHTAGCEHAVDCEKWKTECHSCPKMQPKISRYFRDEAKRSFQKMKAAVEGFEELTVVGVSKWLTDRAAQSPIFNGMTFATVHNGINTDIFCPTPCDIHSELGIATDKKIVLHVTPNFRHPIKGGKFVIELAKLLPNYQFIIVGSGTDGLSLPENMLTINHTKNPCELAKLYTNTDCCISTSLRESFSTVCLEAACCGGKILGFETGGIPEAITEGTGETIPCYDIEQYAKAIVKWCDSTVSEQSISAARAKFATSTMVNSYILLYQGK